MYDVAGHGNVKSVCSKDAQTETISANVLKLPVPSSLNLVIAGNVDDYCHICNPLDSVLILCSG